MIKIDFMKIKWWFLVKHSEEHEEHHKNPEIKSKLEIKLHQIISIKSVARVRRRNDFPLSSIISGTYGETRNSCLLSVE
jgi:hypothetical protein